MHKAKLLKLVDDPRADLVTPELPFIACAIGEMRPGTGGGKKAGMNRLLLSLPDNGCAARTYVILEEPG